ncbi:hypothetical protein F444_14373 [Phytophthora nicotianae P1976]|uniref:Uncharacterized protein n=1 Tax=Phytophthora nicotianae P1976 TaxID=1317066 RepID=A0A080ZQI7_PHYNI|nr:hypothetical protein F444_14373 [Phytophthora nicotianae P1976]
MSDMPGRNSRTKSDMASVSTAAPELAPLRVKKRRKKNTTAKRLRARKIARAAARAAATLTAATTSCPSTCQAAPEAEALPETARSVSEAASVGLVSTLAPAEMATEAFPATSNVLAERNKQTASRESVQLAPAFIAALEEEEEKPQAHVATPPADVTKVGECSDSSIHRIVTTDLTLSGPDYVSSDTNDGSDSDTEMYWRIYGKYYGRSKLTTTSNYVTTKETWQVARINDRRGDSLLDYKYQVLWVNPLVKKRRYYQRTWEPRAQLLADNFRKEIELVDRWKASEVQTFAEFWPTDEYGKNAIGADMDGLCIFNALRRAAELTGRPDIVINQDIEDFVEHQKISRGEDLTKGTSGKIVLVFLRRLRDDGRDFIYRTIALDNFAVAGRRGVRVLSEIKLKNGVYVVAAYNHQSIGHAFVLTVHGEKRLIYDLEEGKPIESADDWIDFYAFVRPFIVFK